MSNFDLFLIHWCSISFITLIIVLTYGWVQWADCCYTMPNDEWITRRRRRRIMAIVSLLLPITYFVSPVIATYMLYHLIVKLFRIAFDCE